MRRGSVATPADFIDLGSRESVHRALSRNALRGAVRQVARGVYELPAIDEEWGPVPTSVDAVARALARRDGSRIQPSGAHAANLLGISTQVPVRAVYLTDGPSRSVKVGNRKVVFKHVQAKDMVTSKRISGTVIHALRWTGKRGVDERTVASLRRTLSASDRSQLLRDLRFAPGWIAEAMRQIATDS